MKKPITAYIILGAMLSACTPEDDKVMEYCQGISEASESIIKMRNDGLEKTAALSLINKSDLAEDKHMLSHLTYNIELAYRYPNMPKDIYKKEIFNHCIASE